MICERCFLKVEDWHDFKKLCDDTQSKLRTSVNNSSENALDMIIKEEINTDEEVQQREILESSLYIKNEPIDQDDIDIFVGSEEDNDMAVPQLSPQFPVLSNNDENIESLLIPSRECSVSNHGIEAQPVRCRVCSKMFSTKGNRIKHEVCVHNFNADSPITDNDVDVEIHELDMDPVSIVFSDESNDGLQYTGLPQEKPQTESEFLEHYKNMNYMIKNNLCHHCNYRFTSKKSLFAHLRKHMNLEIFTCYYCCITFPNISQFRYHTSKNECKKREKMIFSGTCPTKPYQNYKCNYCDFLAVSNESINAHIGTKHDAPDLTATCPQCNSAFGSIEEFTGHMFSSCILRIYCSICKTDYASMDDFNEHCTIHDDNQKILGEATSHKRSIVSGASESVVNPLGLIALENNKSGVNNCHHCKKIYSNYNNLMKHLKMFHREPAITICKLCPPSSGNSKFVLKTLLAQHMLTNHKTKAIKLEDGITELSKFSCNTCGSLFSSLGEWKVHQKDHLLCHKCDECGDVFTTAPDLAKHKQEHSNLKLKLYRCSESNSYMTSSTVPKLSCTMCNVNFKSKKELDNHSMLHEDISELENTDDDIDGYYKCAVCDKPYKFLKSLQKHEKLYHCNSTAEATNLTADVEFVPVNKRRKCLICNIIFASKKSLYTHHRKYHYKKGNPNQDIMPLLHPVEAPSEYKPIKSYSCHLCQAVFPSNIGLSNHIRIHTAKTVRATKICEPRIMKELKCIRCFEIFTSIETLQEHVYSHMQPSMFADGQLPKKIYPCIYCEKICTYSPALISHMKIHDISKVKNARRKCKFCNKSVPNARSLALHLKKFCKKVERTGKRCNLCKKSFRTRHGLASHMKAHRSKRNNKKDALQLDIETLHNTNSDHDSPINQVENDSSLTHYSQLNNVISDTEVTDSPNGTPRIHRPKGHSQADDSEKFHCDACDLYFVSVSSMKSHKGWHKRPKKWKFGSHICVVCNMYFKNEEDLAAHENRHREKGFVCKHCTKPYAFLGSYIRHLQSMHNDYSETLGSPETDMEQKSVNVVPKHKKIVFKKMVRAVEGRRSSVVVRHYKCTECNTNFPNAKQLRLHVMSHVNTTI